MVVLESSEEGEGVVEESTEDNEDTGTAPAVAQKDAASDLLDCPHGGEEEEEDEDDDDDYEYEECDSAGLREANRDAMRSGSGLDVSRDTIMPGYLSVTDPRIALRRPFRSPKPEAPSCSSELQRRIAIRRQFVPWGSAAASTLPQQRKGMDMAASASNLPAGVEPLVLWRPSDEDDAGASPIEVDGCILQYLRPHQREGVQFLFECVTGMRDYEGRGCILADDMGLVCGKTLQAICLIWTLLNNSMDGQEPLVRRVVISCPTSLVGNWDSECEKWLNGRIKTLPLAECSKEQVESGMRKFVSTHNNGKYQVLIASYETFRKHTKKFKKEGSVDLLICDEAHRLKNAETQTNKELGALPCKARILISGTPLQNHLDEFYSMVSFCNPGLLGTANEFHRRYERPILQGREPDATEDQRSIGEERALELSDMVNKFILRRTNSILSKHLPPKVVEVVCCNLTSLQQQLYEHFLSSKAARAALTGKQSKVLGAITALRKLVNHPKLIFDMLSQRGSEQHDDPVAGFDDCGSFFPEGLFDTGNGKPAPGWETTSGKFYALVSLLEYLRKNTSDRVVVVSNFTQTLDLISSVCKEQNWPCVRLDGTTTAKKRKKMVTEFNDPKQQQFVFLLSSKAGGCGLNLIGGNRLVLFDPDWNPATDKQAAARIWRDGQKKRVYIYRFLATGTLEERVFQRQLSKEGLQGMVDSGGQLDSSIMSQDELSKLFNLQTDTKSDTHDSIRCNRCTNDSEAVQTENAAEDDLASWSHHWSLSTLPDRAFASSKAAEYVSFVLSLQVGDESNLQRNSEAHMSQQQGKQPDADELQRKRAPLQGKDPNQPEPKHLRC